ncbi:MAG: hypothetical protein D6718_13260 [Acidobacteria bacterium]|nr:MAG: hypothetical protein D6718_13260 [Acidobacteriota bacterium]
MAGNARLSAAGPSRPEPAGEPSLARNPQKAGAKEVPVIRNARIAGLLLLAIPAGLPARAGSALDFGLDLRLGPAYVRVVHRDGPFGGDRVVFALEEPPVVRLAPGWVAPPASVPPCGCTAGPAWRSGEAAARCPDFEPWERGWHRHRERHHDGHGYRHRRRHHHHHHH